MGAPQRQRVHQARRRTRAHDDAVTRDLLEVVAVETEVGDAGRYALRTTDRHGGTDSRDAAANVDVERKRDCRPDEPVLIRFFTCAVLCSFVQFCAVLCSLVQFGAVWCSLVQLGAAWCSLVQFGAVWCSLVQFRAVSCSFAQ